MNIPRGEKCPNCGRYSVYRRGRGNDWYWKCANCASFFTDAELKGKLGMMTTPIGWLFGNEGGHTVGGATAGESKNATKQVVNAIEKAGESPDKGKGDGTPNSTPAPAPTPNPAPSPIPKVPRNPVWALVLFIVGVSAFSYIYYVTPVHGIFDEGRTLMLQYLPAVWTDLVFNFLPGFIILIFLAIYLIGGLLRGKFDLDFISGFFRMVGAFYLIISVMIGIGYIFYVYLLGAGVLTPYLCSMNLKDLLLIDPNAADKCLTQPQSAPDNTKNGITQLDQSSIGSDQANGVIPTVYQGETYVLPFTIKNLDPDNSLDGVYVKGKLVGQLKQNGDFVDSKLDLVPNTCSQDDACSVLPGSSQTVELQSSDKISFYSPGYADVTVNTIYPYTAFGKGDVIAANPDAKIPQDAFTKPESGPGPVDVVVFFAPQYFTTGSKLTKIVMFVDVINRGQGLIQANSMLIKRLTSTDLLGTASCKVPGFDQAFAENNNQTFDNLEFKTEAQFVCSLPIQQSSTQLTQFVHIPFTASFGYNYIETTTDSYPIKLLSS